MRTVLLGAAALVLLTLPALGADMHYPLYKAPPAPAALWNWTGCYIGGHAGGVWATQKDWIVKTPGGAFYGQSLGEHEASGSLGGVQAGCDYQFVGGFLTGIQSDYAWIDAEGRHDSARELGVAYHSKLRSLATVTGRIGYGWDRFLGYVKGGGAWERDDYWATTILLGTAYTAQERSEEHTSELQSRQYLVCRLLSPSLSRNRSCARLTSAKRWLYSIALPVGPGSWY